MKIAIMTWFAQDNYGTVLQAAALTRQLKALGHEADIICYFPKDTVYTLPGKAARRSIIRQLRAERKDENNPVIVSQRAGDAFAAFRSSCMTLTRYCETMTDLEALNEEYDAFVCGSDLIWLPRYFDPHYYLDFVRDSERMIAYAPSFLEDGLADRFVLEQMGTLIRRFKHLSVREGAGRRMMDSVFEIQTEEVADPVLMMDAQDWHALLDEHCSRMPEADVPQAALPAASDEMNVSETPGEAPAESAENEGSAAAATETPDERSLDTAANAPEDSAPDAATQPAEENPSETAAEIPAAPQRGYLLQFFQGDHFTYREAAQKLAERLDLDLKIIPIHRSDLDRPGCITDTVGPLEFADLIRKASYVCTDSYHATCLSLLFGREICCFDRFTERGQQGRNARIHYILDLVGLSGRLYDGQAPLENFLSVIDWIPVSYKMDALRLKSDKYLRSALDDVQLHINRTRPEHLHVLEGYTLCTGCGACEHVCPHQAVSVTTDELGFLHASVNEDACQRCGECTQVCPMRHPLPGSRIASGKLLSYKDEENDFILGCGAGGLASRLAHILHGQGVGIAGCVASHDDQETHHVLVKPDEDPALLEQFKGAHASQSSLQSLWEALQEYPDPVAVFGMPCQISAVKKVFPRRENLICIDLVCAGVPSALLHQKYELALHKKHFLRRPRIKEESMQRIADLGSSFMEACYECRWRDLSQADLRLGDLRTDFPGRRGAADATLAICLTEKGKHLLEQLMISGYWEGLKKEDISAYIQTHPARNPIKPVFYRELMGQLSNQKTSVGHILSEYVKPLEKKRLLPMRDSLYYSVGQSQEQQAARLIAAPDETPED